MASKNGLGLQEGVLPSVGAHVHEACASVSHCGPRACCAWGHKHSPGSAGLRAGPEPRWDRSVGSRRGSALSLKKSQDLVDAALELLEVILDSLKRFSLACW